MKRMPHKVTVKEIAKESGVSTATVSRVINGYPFIKPETQRKVEMAIKTLNYTPNAMARSLRYGNVKMLALIVSDITNPFYPQLCRGIQDQASKYYYHVVVCNTDLKSDREFRYLKELEELRISGVIFGSVLMDSKESVLRIARKGIPTVLVNRRFFDEQIDYVVTDNKLGGMIATEHLISLGHERIAHIGGPANSSNSVERLQGYLQALTLHKIKIDHDFIKKTDFSSEAAYKAIYDLFAHKKRPTAIFVVNDYMAIAAIAALQSIGFKVPEDVAVVGFDGLEIASMELIQLTTVSQRIYEMGKTAVDIIMQKINHVDDKSCHQITLKPELIVRRTCGASLHKQSAIE